MRMAFGLVSILVVMAIILYLLAGRYGSGGQSYLGTVMSTKKETDRELNKLSGRDPQGQRLHESLTLATWPEAGSLKGLKVTQVDPAGIAAAHFGLQKGDIIVQIGPHPIGDIGSPITGLEAGEDFLDTAFARGQQITVRRNDEAITLPDPSTTPGTTPGAAPGGSGTVLPGGLQVPTGQ